MATFNVFVEGAVDVSARGLPELADAMSQRYGLPAAELVERLERGRFRVKSNLDSATAERYRKDLVSIGARVVIEDADVSPNPTPVIGLPVAPATTPAAAQLAPLPDVSRTHTILGGPIAREPARPATSVDESGGTPLARPPARTPSSGLAAAGAPARPRRPTGGAPTPIASEMSSGLAAGFGDPAAASDFGALDGALALAPLGGDDRTSDSGDGPELSAPIINIIARPKTDAPRAKPQLRKPVDLFAPPDAGDQDVKVDLAVEEIAERAQKRASVPPQASSMLPATRRNTPQPAHVVLGSTSVATEPFSRAHFIAGVVLALLVAFVPVHFFAKSRERAAAREIDARLSEVYEVADSPETYLAIDGAREKLLEDKQRKCRSIAVTSMLMWAVLSASLAFAFFRFVPKKPAM